VLGGDEMSPFIKAQKIRDHIVNTNAIDYWIGRAKVHTRRKDQHQPGPEYTRDVNGLVAELKSKLQGQLQGADDFDLRLVAGWIFDQTPL
jgi:hypothetical protein